MLKREINKFKGLIFDFDGTLVDSLGMWKNIDHIFLGRFGLTVPVNLDKAICGMNFHETAAYFKKRFNLPLSLEEIEKEWINLSYNEYLTNTPFIKGAKAFLKKHKDKPLAIATSNHGFIAEDYLKNQGIDYIDFYAHTGNCAHGKPYPDLFLLAAKGLGLDPKDCLAFEDTDAGVMAAKSAGMTVVSLNPDVQGDYNIKDYEKLL